ncbi:MAG: FAD-binding protein, partial [Actinomycetales bacterium]
MSDGGPSWLHRSVSTVVEDLQAVLPHGDVLIDPDVTDGYGRDQAAWAPAGRPVAVVRARSTTDVQATVKVCAAHRVPVVARGAGTGLSGAANATDGCVVITLEKMAAVLEVDPVEHLAVVQPGVVNDHLRSHVAEHGLWYPPDPASSPWSTIGGNVATNAGGLCCVKYGVTGDYVLALEMVTGTGEVVRLGGRTAKGVAGYDLKSLVVGSEGTLGIVTEVTVRLRPLPPPSVTVAGYFDSVSDAGEAVRSVGEAGIGPAALELVDRTCLVAVDAWKNMGLSADANVVLLARLDDGGDAAEAAAARV